MWHAVYAGNQSLCDGQSVCLLFQYESARQLSLQFLQIVVAIVSHLVADADQHEL